MHYVAVQDGQVFVTKHILLKSFYKVLRMNINWFHKKNHLNEIMNQCDVVLQRPRTF